MSSIKSYEKELAFLKQELSNQQEMARISADIDKIAREINIRL